MKGLPASRHKATGRGWEVGCQRDTHHQYNDERVKR